MPGHPFPDDLVAAVADERGVDPEELRAALADVQHKFERGDGEDRYEYSSQHNYGWEDDQLFYLYGSESVWQALQRDLSLDDAVTGAARDVHERAMLQSASARGEEQNVREMLADGNEPLAVANRGSGPPRFGQDV